MKISLRNITISTFKLIKKDKIIFAPYLFFFLCFGLLENMYNLSEKTAIKNLLAIVAIGWLVEILFKALIISMADSLRAATKIHLKETIISTLKRLPHLIISTLIVLLPIIALLGLVYRINNQENVSAIYAVASVFLVIALILVSLILEFIPIYIICEKQGAIKSILSSVKFVKANFAKVILLSLISIFIVLNTFMLSSIFEQIPVIGTAFLKSLFQSLGYTFIYALAVVFYFQIKEAQSTISEVR